MCGIFGFSAAHHKKFSSSAARKMIEQLLRLSQSRGKESCGLAFCDDENIHVLKRAQSAARLLRSRAYRQLAGHIFSAARPPRVVIGHSRLITDSMQREAHDNNQPVIKDRIVGIHNGIVVNDAALWKRYPQLVRNDDVDTEIILALVRLSLDQGKGPADAVSCAFEQMEGAASIALLFEDQDALVCATNNGSLYYAARGGVFVFGSERMMLERLFRPSSGVCPLEPADIRHLLPGFGLVFNFHNAEIKEFSLREGKSDLAVPPAARTIVDHRPQEVEAAGSAGVWHQPLPDLSRYEREFQQVKEAASKLRRCSRCVLPETMPFITFDEKGECNYCRAYQPLALEGQENFLDRIGVSADKDTADCVVGLSGGRDSCYGLHYIVRELGLRPIAFTYDWGMVTDIARRNISRLCGRLGVEHVLVSADIRRKLFHVRKNLEAWLRRPDLGMIPLFMAGDKQYFYHAQRVRRETRSRHIVLCENMLERTDFKTGFCGVAPFYDQDHVYTLPAAGRIKLAAYYGRRYLENVKYLNASLADTLGAYLCFYFLPRTYLNLYRFIPWNEERINTTLVNEYGWETSPDCASTWRIGDGTASFYNYVYFLASGFSEHDTLRSNQVREGMMNRDQALQRIGRDNTPRYETMAWYCRRVGVDIDDFFRGIHQITKAAAIAQQL